MKLLAGLLTLGMAATACFGQEPEAPKLFKLEFVVREVTGSKVLNSRAYTTTLSTGGNSEIRAGGKLQYAATPTNYLQVDVGMNIDVRGLKEVQDRLAFSVVAEMTSLPEDAGRDTRPVIRQNRWSSNVIVPLKKPTLLFSSESVDAKTQLQVEVTATAIP